MKLKETIQQVQDAYNEAIKKREYYRAEVYRLEGMLKAYQTMQKEEGCTDCAKKKIIKKNDKQQRDKRKA